MASPKDNFNRSRCSDGGTDLLRSDDAVVKPVKGKRSIRTESPVVLVGTKGDLKNLIRLLSYTSVHPQPLFNSCLYKNKGDLSSAVLAGPIVGAPYAAMLMETLIAWGARQFIFLGWCGSISKDVKIGDIIVPTRAIIDEGTSTHYSGNSLASNVSHPGAISLDRIRQQFSREKMHFHAGAVWTTDAIFRETPEKIRHFTAQGASAVDMETSALFAIACYRGVEIGSILVVSDELSTMNWVPGFKTEEFSAGRSQAYEVIRHLCRPTPIPKS